MNILKDKKIVITGGAGFIGSNLCEFFLSNDNKVICLDNLSTGKRSNIQHLENNSNFQFVLGDIRDEAVCHQVCENADIVFHEAALGSVPRSIKDPITTNSVNISGQLNMLIAARDCGVKRFIFACSSSTYGDSKELPKKEEIIGNPLSPYAITKYVNELYANVFHNIYGLDYIGLRYFNVFGYKQDTESTYAAVIPIFVKKLLNGEAPIINGDGNYSRDFTFIENVVHANYLAAITDNTAALNNIYNVACGESTSLNQLADYLKEILSQYDSKIADIEFIHGENRLGDIPHSLASIEKAERLLGYHPLYKIKEGLIKACQWYVNHL
ncbi:MAG: SDR family oxidoreductase [Bacteroidales bacterium]|jgi:UDP-N-acetylglucosamine 4-epimerase|nr:SDR family oxidoreductase [Bacteroidales bacterium]MBR4453433.1 SDR family oxidoreductase [Bacteroidales bacterium]